jgi:hypothetical protein
MITVNPESDQESDIVIRELPLQRTPKPASENVLMLSAPKRHQLPYLRCRCAACKANVSETPR